MTQSNDGIRTSRRRILKTTGAIVAGLAAPTLLRMSSALAAYPDRPIKIVVANTPGGPSDISARMIAAEMQQVLGGSVFVENKGGAGGNIGYGFVARSEPDGYTILLTTSAYVVNPSLYNSIPYDPFKDFAPVVEIAAAPEMISVNPSLPVSNMKELIALLKANPGKYNYAIPGYGTSPHLGAEWLFKRLGGKGNVVEMRGIAGVPADTDRHNGFRLALKKYPGIKVVKQTFTGWSFAPGGKQMLDILNSGVKVDGVWTSGIDYTVVNAFKTAGKPYVPVVGADNNQFLKQLLTVKGLRGAAVTNPATIGGAGAAVAIKLLQGKSVATWVKLTPEVWDNGTAAGKAKIKANFSPSRAPTYSARLQIKPWTTYSTQQLFSCKGP